VSYGNACDIDESDLLEYLTTDPETEIIAAYIEGVKDGKRFSKALRGAAAAKPVILMKGGRSEAGARAVASHTGALAGSAKIWDGLLQQAGVISVPTLEEMADSVVTFLHLAVPQGRRLGTISVGGGAAVVATDSYVSAGLVLPPLSQQMRQKLRSFVSTDAGISLNNPVDLASEYWGPGVYPLVKALADYSEIDILVFHFPLGMTPAFSSMPKEGAIPVVDNVIRVHNETSKPIAVVIDQLATSEAWETAFSCQQKCHEAGIPVYFSINSAAKAIDRFLRYHENHAQLTA
jgi:acyl-CoA synthetase (NDP forming)